MNLNYSSLYVVYNWPETMYTELAVNCVLHKADLKLVDQDAANMERLKRILKSDAEFQLERLCCDMDFDTLVKGTDTLFHLVSTTKPANSNRDIKDLWT